MEPYSTPARTQPDPVAIRDRINRLTHVANLPPGAVTITCAGWCGEAVSWCMPPVPNVPVMCDPCAHRLEHQGPAGADWPRHVLEGTLTDD